jgi:uncharacterized protein (DUF1697 family)
MARFVALFRGINVGKAKRIAMADLRALLGKLGYTDVQTLLNSGNAVFSAEEGRPAEHAARIRTAVAKKLGVDASVVVKSERDIAAIIKGNTIDDGAAAASRFLVAVWDQPSIHAELESFARADWAPEKVHVNKHAAYLWCANGILESKAIEGFFKATKNEGTTRNWATLNKIHALLRGADGR